MFLVPNSGECESRVHKKLTLYGDGSYGVNSVDS